MTILYSETLLSLYHLSAGWQLGFYALLAIISVANFRLFKGVYRWFLILFVGYFLFELSFYVFGKVIPLKNNLFLGHPYLFFSAFMLAVIYYKIIDNALVKKVISVLIPLLLVAIVILFFYQKGYTSRPLMSDFYQVIFLFVFIYTQSQLLKSSKVKHLTKEPLYWFNTAFLVYTLIIIIFTLLNPIVVQTSDDLAFILGIIKNIIEPIYLVLMCIGVLKLKKNNKPIISI